MRTLYFDCFSGISGDMTVGALLDVGADEKALLEGMEKLKVDGYRIEIEKKLKNGISGTDFSVILEDHEEYEEHEYHEHHHDGHDHGHDHDHHVNEHNHGHQHVHNDAHVHRNMSDIEKIINDSELNERVRMLALKIFKLVAEAEGRIHGKPAGEVHFHEVGAVDSIVDIIGTAICIDSLNVDRIVFSSLPLSRGFVRCQHGVFPLPAPATLEILKDVPVYYTDVNFELVTPTGAAIAKGLAEEFGMVGELAVERIGYGLGKKTYEIPNVLRVMLFNSKKKISDRVMEIETNIDDMTAEQLGSVMDRLFEQGALDVFFTPVLMKKNRPGTKLTVLCHQDRKDALTEALLRHTSTFGVRFSYLDRTILDRETVAVDTCFGSIRCKLGRLTGELLKYSPEYEDCKAASEKSGRPISEVYAEAMQRMKEKLQ
ncbi:MAG TPA: nickel pincer cofactor biosynthesis protein LarC [Clostridia bacterium]|nr:nickel pincer cofactor biosynthesis protein LarC [Clostridia bacterium]